MSNSAPSDYVGPVGFEKKVHKTHFEPVGVKLKTTKDNGYRWVRIAPGKFLRLKVGGKNGKENI
jgi:hypothetical protein